MESLPIPKRRSSWHLGISIGVTLIYVVAGCIVTMMIPFGVMAFDSGVSTPALVFFFGLLLIPIILLVGIVLTWLGYVKISTGLVCASIALPILYLAVYFAVILTTSH